MVVTSFQGAAWYSHSMARYHSITLLSVQQRGRRQAPPHDPAPLPPLRDIYPRGCKPPTQTSQPGSRAETSSPTQPSTTPAPTYYPLTRSIRQRIPLWSVLTEPLTSLSMSAQTGMLVTIPFARRRRLPGVAPYSTLPFSKRYRHPHPLLPRLQALPHLRQARLLQPARLPQQRHHLRRPPPR